MVYRLPGQSKCQVTKCHNAWRQNAMINTSYTKFVWCLLKKVSREANRLSVLSRGYAWCDIFHVRTQTDPSCLVLQMTRQWGFDNERPVFGPLDGCLWMVDEMLSHSNYCVSNRSSGTAWRVARGQLESSKLSNHWGELYVQLDYALCTRTCHTIYRVSILNVCLVCSARVLQSI